MRVGFVLADLSGGGAERVILDLSAHLVGRGHQVWIILFSATGEYRSCVPPGVQVLDLGSGSTRRSVLPLMRALKELRVEVACSTLKHVSIAVELARRAGGGRFRHLVRVANTYSREFGAKGLAHRTLLRWAVRFAHAGAAAAVCVSEGVAEDLVRRIGVPARGISVVANPVFDPRMETLGGERTGVAALDDGGPFTVVAAGRLVPQKGFDVLIRAFADALRGRDAHLLILGDGPLRAELQALIESLGVAGQATLAGFARNPFAYLAKASVFVLSSRFEGLPNVLIQAMCFGTRVIATDCPSGPAEILEGGRLGRLVGVDDQTGLAQALRAEFADRAPRNDPAVVRERYAKDARCGDYERIMTGMVR